MENIFKWYMQITYFLINLIKFQIKPKQNLLKTIKQNDIMQARKVRKKWTKSKRKKE